MLNNELKNEDSLKIMTKERDKWEYMLKGNPKMSDSMKQWAKEHINAYNYVINLLNKEFQNEEILFPMAESLDDAIRMLKPNTSRPK